MYSSEDLLRKVNEALENLAYDRQPRTLYDPIQYVLSLGGKRIRPVLMLLAYNLYREDPERIMSQAIGVETYHNFTLLHDDLMDHADMRRGNETVHKKWNANEADKLKDVMDIFLQTTFEIGEGQQFDVEFETRDDVTEAEYIEMIRLKTSVLLACALKMGGIMAGASADDLANLYKTGEQIGLAFQLQDDLLDVYGDPKVFGKNIGGDITSNKKTYMLINALNLSNPEQHAELTRWIEAKTFDRAEKVAAVTKLYNEIGIRQLCEERINWYFEQGCQYLDRVQVPEERKTILRQYIAQMMNRQS